MLCASEEGGEGEEERGRGGVGDVGGSGRFAAVTELEVGLLLVVVLVEVIRRLLGNVQNRLELDLTLGRKVRVRERLAKVLGE